MIDVNFNIYNLNRLLHVLGAENNFRNFVSNVSYHSVSFQAEIVQSCFTKWMPKDNLFVECIAILLFEELYFIGIINLIQWLYEVMLCILDNIQK